MTDVTVAFFGSPELAKRCLAYLLDSFNVAVVISRPDKIRGRGRKVTPTPVKELAISRGIPVYTPEKILPQFGKTIEEYGVDCNVVVAYGQILPREVIYCPGWNSVNLHASLLPELRGPSPIQTAILSGLRKTGITLQLIKEELDAGDIIAQQVIEIEPHWTAEDLLNEIMMTAPDFLVESLRDYIDGRATPVPQAEEKATYCKILKRKDALIDWSESAASISNKIRAYNIWPVAYTYLNGRILKLYNAFVYENGKKYGRNPGAVIDVLKGTGIIVQTGTGVISLTELQLENKKRMGFMEFANGYRNLKGTVLSGTP